MRLTKHDLVDGTGWRAYGDGLHVVEEIHGLCPASSAKLGDPLRVRKLKIDRLQCAGGVEKSFRAWPQTSTFHASPFRTGGSWIHAIACGRVPVHPFSLKDKGTPTYYYMI